MQAAIQSKILGCLQYNAHFKHYEATLSEADAKIELVIKPNAEEDVNRLVDFAEQVWRDRNRLFEAFRQFASSDRVLEEVNTYLRSDEESPGLLSSQQLLDVVQLPDSISITSDTWNAGALNLTLGVTNDARLGEHSLSIYFDSEGRVKDSEVIRLY